LGSATPITSDIFFGFDIAEDIELVADETGFVQGYYILDGFGGQHEVGGVPAYDVSKKPYWAWDIARDLEIVNTYRLVTGPRSVITSQIGYYVLDGFGGVHPVNNDVVDRGDPNNPAFALHHDWPSFYPEPFNYAYWWAFDIARDLEVSYVFSLQGSEIVGQTDGYYVLDGFGAVHNCRVNLDDPNETAFAPWLALARPYFGWDIARDFELTPDGSGYYMLNGFGTVSAVNATISFATGDDFPIFTDGFDIYRDMEMVQGADGSVIGYYVLDGMGVIQNLGAAPDLGQVVTMPTEDVYRDLEVSPLYFPVTDM